MSQLAHVDTVYSAHMILHTNVGLAEEPATLGGGGGRRWVLDLRSGGGARLAHGVGAVHDGGVGGCSGMCVLEWTRLESLAKRVIGVGIWIVVLLWVRRGRRRDLKGHSSMCMHD